MHTDILIVGSGGHAKVVIETLSMKNVFTNIRIVDEREDKKGSFFNQYSVDFLKSWNILETNFHVAIGSNEARSRISKDAIIVGKNYQSIIHPESTISPSAIILDGSFVAANTVISSDALINKGCILNHFASVDHDCIIGEYSHIAPHATLLGGVKVGSHCLIGAGAVILPKISVGNYVVVGAGSIVTRDIPDNMTYFGNPAKEAK